MDEVTYPTVGDREAGYLFEFREDGVFLTVYPSESNETLFELTDLQQILVDYKVEDYDILELAKAIRSASGEPVKISDHFVSPAAETSDDSADDGSTNEPKPDKGEPTPEELANPPAGIIIDVSKDKMEATVRYDTNQGTALPTEQDVLDALDEKGVTFGVDREAVHEGVKRLNAFVVAKGKPPVHGENARIEKKYDLGVLGHPAVDQYNRVDYKNMNLFVLVKKGDLLAERIPQTQGVAGMDVYGVTVTARNGRPIPMPKGNNTEVRDENFVYALIDGQVVEKGPKISVDPHLVIRSGVGVGTGNVDFTGSIEINGNVEAGFIVKATGDVVVNGLVSGDVTGRNVFVSGGISGLNRGKVKAEEDVHAAYVENATVEAGRDITVSDVALHSTLKAGKRIYAQEKKGSIVGGTAAAGEEILAKMFGNPAFVVTRVSVGINPALQQQYKDACQEYKEDKLRLQQVDAMLNTLSKIDTSKLPPQRIEQINKLTCSRFPLAGKVRRTEKLIETLEEELGKMEHGRISIVDRMFPGCRVSVNGLLMNVQSEIQHSKLEAKDDEVKICPF
jgi:hypothetical protein